jgi:hypothetical protein
MIFAIFSDDERGAIQPDNSVKPTWQEVPAWVMSWSNQPCHAMGGAPAPGSTARPSSLGNVCTLLVFVDANSGRYLESYEEGPGTTATVS